MKKLPKLKNEENIFWLSKTGHEKVLHFLVITFCHVPQHLSLRVFVKRVHCCINLEICVLFIASLQLCESYSVII